eukprot:TRINITY_DN88156_c0_g1_i1.p1 TRINITY_DN88156_c0_g1~~TRINITY_DN88156_c0_g1_i1.p1  ORF type:complete len:548 (-),score=47.13 TRINITY_DN88156_c0_g1_i1:526-1992(-)
MRVIPSKSNILVASKVNNARTPDSPKDQLSYHRLCVQKSDEPNPLLHAPLSRPKVPRVNKLLKDPSFDFADVHQIALQSIETLADKVKCPESVPLYRHYMLYKKEPKSFDFATKFDKDGFDILLFGDSKEIYVKKVDLPPELYEAIEVANGVEEKKNKSEPLKYQVDERTVVYAWGMQILKIMIRHLGIYVECDQEGIKPEEWIKKRPLIELDRLKSNKKVLEDPQATKIIGTLEKAIIRDKSSRETFSEIIKILKTGSIPKAEQSISCFKDTITRLMDKKLKAMQEKVEKVNNGLGVLATFSNRISEAEKKVNKVSNKLKKQAATLIRERIESAQQQKVLKEEIARLTKENQALKSKPQGEPPSKFKSSVPTGNLNTPLPKSFIASQQVAPNSNNSSPSLKRDPSKTVDFGKRKTTEAISKEPNSLAKPIDPPKVLKVRSIKSNLFCGNLMEAASRLPFSHVVYPYCREFEGNFLVKKVNLQEMIAL